MKKPTIYFFFILCNIFIFNGFVFAQNVGINTNTPDASAALDVSATDKGMLVPRLTQAQRDNISLPATGLLIYQNDGASGFYYYNGTAWQLLSGATTPSKIQDADANTKIETEKTANEDKIHFSAGGTEYFQMTNGTLEVKNTGQSTYIGEKVALNDIYAGGNENVGIGWKALEPSMASFENVAVGSRALLSMIDGNNNVAIGKDALRSNNNVYNVAVGSFSGANNQTGNGNIFLGYAAGANEMGDNKLYIDNNNTSSPLIYGDFSSNLLKINGTLNINNAYSLPTVAGTNGYILQTDGSGLTSWVNPNTLSISETDPKIGSLSTNYIPKWNGTSLANGQISENATGTGVGIGTTVIPNESKLVLGAVSASEGGQLQLNSGSGASMAYFIDNLNDEFRILAGTNNGSTNGRFFISNTGIVSIGTNTIANEATLVLGPKGLNEGGELQFYSGLPYTAAYFLDIYQDAFRLLSGTNSTSNAEVFRIASGGNMGLGITSPTARLHTATTGTKNSSYTGNLLTNAVTSSNANINKVGVEITSTGSWNGANSNNIGLYVSAVTGGTNNYDAIFNGGGNVGIGSVSPTAKLEVVGKTKTTNFQMTTGATNGYLLQSDATGNASWVNPSTLPISETDPKVGSLSTSYIPKWNGTSLANGQVFDNGTKIGIGTTTPVEKIHIQNGNFAHTGDFGTDSTLNLQGAGSKMFFYPKKAAFRAGYAGVFGWEDSEIGDYSIALGNECLANDDYAVAIGNSCVATQPNSIAIGESAGAYSTNSLAIGTSCSTSGDNSTAMGFFSSTLAEKSMALGNENETNGNNSITLGNNLTTNSYKETILGSYNATYTPNDDLAWNTNDRLLVVGNGADNTTRSNAMVILKNGNTGIGTNTPTAKLQVNGKVKSAYLESDSVVSDVVYGLTTHTITTTAIAMETYDMKIKTGAANGYLLQSDASGNASWVNPNTLFSAESDPKVGTLTDNYVPRWNTTALTNGSIFDNGTKVSIGTTTPNVGGNFGFSKFTVASSNNNACDMNVILAESTPLSPWINVGKARGTLSSPTSVQINDQLLTISANGHNGSFYRSGAEISVNVDNAPTGNSVPGRIAFSTAASGQISPFERMRITSGGNVGIGTTNPSTKLEVSGTAKAINLEASAITKTANFQMTNGASNDYILKSDASGNASWIDPATLATPETDPKVGSLSTNYISKWNGSTLANTQVFDNGTNIGIGSTSPTSKLHILGSSTDILAVEGSNTTGTWLHLENTSTNGIDWRLVSTGSGNSEGAGNFLIQHTGAVRMIIKSSNGVVGIGTSNPTQAKLVVNGSQSNTLSYGYLNNAGNTGSISNFTNNYSIYASDRIAATEFNAFSDARTKKVKGISDNEADLNTLMKLKITDYTLIDTIAKGNAAHKKVIAQEVKAVYPQAVKTITDCIPDIYKLVEVKDDIILFSSQTLREGDKVKLIMAESQEVYEVTSVSEKGFKVDKEIKDGSVFIYGHEVNDFHTVDYEALSTLNISATQALVKRLNETENALKAQSAKLDSQSLRLTKLENLLLKETAAK